MDYTLKEDNKNIKKLLGLISAEAGDFLDSLDVRPAGIMLPPAFEGIAMPREGTGAENTLALFKKRYAPWLSGSAGPRYFGFVTGGVTPAALAGDWLVPVFDQNAVGSNESVAAQIELDTISLLRQLFGLPGEFDGTFVTGATMANFVGLANGRQWLGRQLGVDIAQDGISKVGSINIFSGTPHSSIYKALSMLGIGRNSLHLVDCQSGREVIDLGALREQLMRQKGRPCIVVANAGTVNTVDFDDLANIAALKEKYPFWLHVDAAFGGFAACSPQYRHLVQGLELADSITIDAHKWLNVPYDAAMSFTRHIALQAETFQNAAVYLGEEIRPGSFVHLTPENSRRLRALPCWFTLIAYGLEGYGEIVERCCRLAGWIGQQIAASDQFALLAPVKMNGVCFTLKSGEKPADLVEIKKFLFTLQASGKLFLTPTIYRGSAAVRLSVSNWRTTKADIVLAWETLQSAAAAYSEN